MSLILEALKKLDRERDVSGRGFLVVAHSEWPARRRGRVLRLGALVLAIGAAAGLGAWMAWRLLAKPTGAVASSAPVAAVSSSPAATSAAALPPPIWEGPHTPISLARAQPAASAQPAPASAPILQVQRPAPVAPRPSPSPVPSAAPAAVAFPALRLEAISSQDGQPVAVINGQVVRAGEHVGDALVVWIGADAVEVEVGGRRRVIGF